jgi:hypothetical protein
LGCQVDAITTGKIPLLQDNLVVASVVPVYNDIIMPDGFPSVPFELNFWIRHKVSKSCEYWLWVLVKKHLAPFLPLQVFLLYVARQQDLFFCGIRDPVVPARAIKRRNAFDEGWFRWGNRMAYCLVASLAFLLHSPYIITISRYSSGANIFTNTI